MPPKQVETKQIDPEAELSNVVRTFRKLAPMCSVEKRAAGIPQLATQEKQLNILTNEMHETVLCIDLARKGLHAYRDAQVKRGTIESIMDYERLNTEVRNEIAQQNELDCLNYLSRKQLNELQKIIPTDTDELKLVEIKNLRLRQMENRLEMATKKFCVVNAENMKLRQEINRYLVERNDFNIQWNRTIDKLRKGKEYLLDLFEIASQCFDLREETCTKLEALKWKGLFQLNRDIAEMQTFECELNHLTKIEEFLRVKGSRRICEADEKEEMKRLEEIALCEKEIALYDALLKAVFEEAECDDVDTICLHFDQQEVMNYGTFEYLCVLLQESIILRKDLEMIRQRILDQRDFNAAREEKETNILDQLRAESEKNQETIAEFVDKNSKMSDTISTIIKGIDELVRLAKCETTPLLTLLGNNKEVTSWNAPRYLKILECETKSLLETVYGLVKPPPPTPGKGQKKTSEIEAKIVTVADPLIIKLRPNRIDKLMPYMPCAYCVEDYITNLVFETPACPADDEYIQSIFHLEEENTKFGIYTLTVPSKRHPYRGKKD